MKKVNGSSKHLAKRALSILAFVLVLAIACGIGALVLARSLDQAPQSRPSGQQSESGGTEFTVEAGESSGGIAMRLEREKLIRSALFFRLWLRISGTESALQAGHYLIEPGATSGQIIRQLADGKQLLVQLRIPEGITLTRIAELAEEAGVASAKDILTLAVDPAFALELGLPKGAGLEGYLYPDTYFLPKAAGANVALSLMVSTFRTKLSQAIPESVGLPAEELHKKVILASIVEREYRLPEEAPRMASVFLNRLKIGMALQSCATVVYVITQRLGKPHPSRLFDRDLEIPDPFNTYRQPGLPPAPIANPGLVALSAVFRPESSRYLYFRLVDEASGRHYFSETLDKHIRAGSLSVKPGSP